MHMWPMPETPLKRINSIDVPEMNDQDLTPIGMPPSTEPKQLEGTSTKMKLGDRPNIKPKRKELSGFAASRTEEHKTLSQVRWRCGPSGVSGLSNCFRMTEHLES
jgi:hypothetical protein